MLNRTQGRFRISIKLNYLMLVLGLSVVGIMLTCLILFNPAENSFFPPCPFKYTTGFNCPGCGSTRASYAFLHGNFLEAVDLNPLLFLSIPLVGYLFLVELDIEINGRKIFRRHLFKPWFYRTVLIVVVAYWVLRNVPVYPFTILAP